MGKLKFFFLFNIIIVVLSNVANLLNYFFQVMMGRFLSTENFGILNSLLSITVILSLFAVVIQFVIAKDFIAVPVQERASFVKARFRSCLFFSVAMILFLFASYPLLCFSIGVYNFPLIAVLIISPAVYVLQGFYNGLMQGGMMLLPLVIIQVVTAITRIFCGFLFVKLLPLSSLGAMLSILIAIIIGLIFSHISLRAFYRPDGDCVCHVAPSFMKIKHDYQFLITLSFMLLAILLLTNIDVVLVKHYCSENDTGLFTSATILARVAQFLPASLLAVLFPKVLKEVQDGKSSTGTVFVVMLLTVFLAGGYLIFVLLYPVAVLTFVFGESYTASASLLRVVTFSMVFMAVLGVLFNYFLAKKEYFFIFPTFVVIFVMIAVIVFKWNHTSMQIALCMLWGTFGVFVVNLGFLFFLFLKNKMSINV
jgi:O-antigen/teichoic acid export membrane protein